MKRYKITILGLLLMIGLGGSTLAIERSTDKKTDTSAVLAQAEPDTSQSQMSESDMPMRRGRFGKGGEFGHGPGKFERLRMKKLMQLLKLEGQQKDAFVVIAEKYRDQRRDLMRSHLATVDSLASGVRSGSLDAKSIDRLIGRLEELEAGQAKTKEEFRREVRPLLSAEQYGKLVVFDYRFEPRILDRLNNFRKHRGGPPPGMPPGPPDDMDGFLESDSI